MKRPTRRASLAFAILATTGAAAACALDTEGGGAGDAVLVDSGVVATNDGGARLDATPNTVPDGEPADTSTDDVPVIPPPPDAAPDTAIDAGPAPLCNAAPNGLSVWLHGGLAYDGALHVAPLTPRGAAATQTAADGGVSWTLGGAEDALQYGSAATIVDDGMHLTIEGFIDPATVGVNARIVDRSLPNKPETGWGFDILTGGVLRTFYGPFTMPFHYAQTASGAVHAGAWQHVAGVLDISNPAGPMASVTISLYIDGVAQPSDPALGPGVGHYPDARPIPAGSLPILFGGSPEAGANLGFVGQLGDVALWKRALTAEEIKTIATGGALVRCTL